jgi:hypothetical protein
MDQHDPNMPRRTPDPFMEGRDDIYAREPVGVLPILVGLAVLLGFGFLVYTTDWSKQPDTAPGQRTEAPATAPAATPPATNPQ